MNKAFLLSISIFLGSLTGQGASLCRDTFAGLNISAASIAAVIQNLAEMKLSLDQNKAQGELKKSAVAKQAVQQFTIKYLEVLRSVQDHMSEPELRHAIEEQISKLQSENKIDVEKEKETTKTHREVAEKNFIPDYEKVSRQTIHIARDTLTPLFYLPEHKKAITTTHTQAGDLDVYLNDLDSGTETKLDHGVMNIKVSADKKRALLLYRKSFATLDLTSFTTSPPKNLPNLNSGDLRGFEISPDLSRLAIASFDKNSGKTLRIFIVDSAQGQIIKEIATDEVSFPLADPTFIDNNTLLFFGPEMTTMTRLDLPTMQTTTRSFAKNKHLAFSISDDRAILVVNQRNPTTLKTEITTMNTHDLSIMGTGNAGDSGIYPSRVIQNPVYKNQFIIIQKAAHGLSLRAVDNPERVLFDFGNEYDKVVEDSNQVLGVDFSPDGKGILIHSHSSTISYDPRGSLDVWRLHEYKK